MGIGVGPSGVYLLKNPLRAARSSADWLRRENNILASGCKSRFREIVY
jgi:hypothetical protein